MIILLSMMTSAPPAIAESPFPLLHDILGQALALGQPAPLAMILATAGADGKPSSRTVLLKHSDENGFIFFTNRHSRKGRQLLENPYASLTFYLPQLKKQIHAEGPVSQISERESDAYWHTRPRESQIGAWASAQSREIPEDDDFAARVREFESRFADETDIPRPRHWGGYIVQPVRIEFWFEEPHRLHQRLCYVHANGSWSASRLFP